MPGWNEIDAVAIRYCGLAAERQWASGVGDYSSQYGVTDWSAQQALGSPDVYPAAFRCLKHSRPTSHATIHK